MTQERNTKDGGRSCWKTARERERLRARFEIRHRVATGLASRQVREGKDNELDIETANTFLRYVSDGSVSSFSLTALSKNVTLVASPLPSYLFPEDKIRTLCTSRYGPLHAEKVIAFRNARETCTLMEYAALLGEYRVIGALLVGGIDPTISGQLLHHACHQPDVSTDLALRILRRFFDCFPTALKTYIVKRVVDMRLRGWVEGYELLCFGEPCMHSFPEEQLWSDLLSKIDECDVDDIVCCPVCGKTPSSSKSKVDTDGDVYSTPQDRCAQSLEKFFLLPDMSKEVKAMSKGKPRKKPAIASSWRDALVNSLGNSKDVRIDKLFSSVERGSTHFVRGCLESGVDINMVNEYGQTVLYIAAWKGYSTVVNLLLEFGANPLVVANGGSTARAVAIANGHYEIAFAIGDSSGEEFAQSSTCLIEEADWSSSKVKTLIPVDWHHPGAGSFFIDDALPELYLEALTDLRMTLPQALTDKKKHKKVELCSNRFYYSDAHGWVRRLLRFSISRSWAEAIVLPHMRFLDYDHAGSELAPHVDLCRVDTDSGQRSTHTFILYLYTCDTGGETILLERLVAPAVELAKVAPVRGRLLLFPHNCPHMGAVVVHVPKLLLRGEVILFDPPQDLLKNGST